MRSLMDSKRWISLGSFAAGLITAAACFFTLEADGRDDAGHPMREGRDVRPDGTVDDDEFGIEALSNFLQSFRELERPDALPELPSRRQLAERRYAIAGTQLESELQMLLAPRSAGNPLEGHIPAIIEWARYRLEAGLILARDETERIKVLERELTATIAMQDVLLDSQQAGAAGTGPGLDVALKLELYRLELEEQLVEMRAE